MTQTQAAKPYRLVETLNGQPRPFKRNFPHVAGTAESAVGLLRERAAWWQARGFLMLHAAGALTATGFNAASGEMLVVTFEPA